ncbi:hypothetical protein [Acinetobacter baumannii]|uniref:hypothetical protein n=2 Tax=Acinetobacter baumannii TaxID=470 RepID=UPI003D7FE1D3
MNRLQFLLLKLSEERNEVAQMASKCMQFGLLERHPELDENNKQRLHAELNDLNAIINMLNAQFKFGYEPDNKAMNRKVSKVVHYMEYSVSIGCVHYEVPKEQYEDARISN